MGTVGSIFALLRLLYVYVVGIGGIFLQVSDAKYRSGILRPGQVLIQIPDSFRLIVLSYR